MKKAKADEPVEEISISYFTDPLCAWSWAFETTWQQVKQTLGSRLRFSYHMGGLIPDWNSFNDLGSSVTRPLQMGPVWMHIAEVTQVNLDPAIWMRDPPSSSYPACIAFKCAELQSKKLADIFLFLLRESVMLLGRNISKTETLLDLADNPDLASKGFDKVKFKHDLFDGAGLEAFRKDLSLIQSYHITRFPTLVAQTGNKPALLISGCKTYDELMRIIGA